MDADPKWYVIHTLSGHEQKALESIRKRTELEEMGDVISEALLPMEKVTEVKQGRKTTTNRKFYPGYIMVKLKLYDDQGQLSDRVWTFIHNTPGVIGFIGEKPLALGDDEVTAIMEQMHRGEETAKPKIAFEVGEMVKIRDGPFENFEGRVESVDPDHGRLKLSVTIFGRATPLDVEYWQVEKGE